MEFIKRFSKGMTTDELADALAAFQLDLEREANLAINDKHAPILVPRVAIDPAHAQYNFAAADRNTILTALSLQSTGTTTSNSIQTAVNYTGRGLLQMCLLGEFTSGATSAISAGDATLLINLDGNILLNDSSFLNRLSSIRVAVGNLNASQVTALCVVDDGAGLPFNNSCIIQYKSEGSKTLRVGWKIAKKL